MKKNKVGGIDLTKKYVCMECGCQRDPIWVKRGWLIVEIVMWLLYVLPGVIYSIWTLKGSVPRSPWGKQGLPKSRLFARELAVAVLGHEVCTERSDLPFSLDHGELKP